MDDQELFCLLVIVKASLYESNVSIVIIIYIFLKTQEVLPTESLFWCY